MGSIEFAERRYRQILPAPVRDRVSLPVPELKVWLRDDVAPLVSEYIARPKFRETACWSLQEFRPNTDTRARGHVDQVAEALKRHARLLRSVLKSRRVSAAVEAYAPPLRHVDEEVVTLGGSSVETTKRTIREIARLPVMTSQVDAIARPFWADLVDPGDYLEPRGRWLVRKPQSASMTAGEFVVSLNPQLHAIGDFVTRCLMRRVEILVELLEEVRNAVLSAARSAGLEVPKSLSEVVDDTPRLRDAARQLYAFCCQDPEAGIRDSVVILTQVYAAYHPAPNVAWLGLDDGEVLVGRAALRQRLENARNVELPERVAEALRDLKRLYANEPPGQSTLDEAIARGGLVLDTSSFTVYWKGRRLSVDWGRHKRPWDLLFELARKRQHGGQVESEDLFDEESAPSAMATLYGRLKKLLPPDLWKLAIRGKTPRSYRLMLDHSMITIINKPF